MPLELIQNAAVEVVMPIFRSMVDMAEDLIMAMHDSDLGSDSPPGDVTNASRYMESLSRHITHCRSAQLLPFWGTPG